MIVRKILVQSIKPTLNRHVSYVQGQIPDPKTREYFYYIDHQGMLFLDDSKMKNFTSCFKDKTFLRFFFKRLKINNTGRYQEDFPYLSPCANERNFVRCDDLPIVYTHIIKEENQFQIQYGHAGNLLVDDFYPSSIFQCPQSGRLYHPGPSRLGGVALIASKLAIQISPNLIFEKGETNSPTHFLWNGNKHELNFTWYFNAVDNLTNNLNVKRVVKDDY